MPQLNPSPWFLTLYITWMIFFALLGHMTNTFTPQTPMKHNTMYHPNPWTWAWL